MRRYSTTRVIEFHKVIKRKRPKRWWQKVWEKNKDIFLLFIGALFTLGATFIVNYHDNSVQLSKEFRERKDAYANNYIKELNQRYFLLVQLYDEEKNNNGGSNLKDYKEKLEENRQAWLINFKYDSIQFDRYFEKGDYDRIKKIDILFKVNIDLVEGNNQEYKSQLQAQIFQVYDLINELEGNIYKDIDKD